MQDLTKITITPQTSIKEALACFGHHDRLRMLIVENDKFQGIITEQDIRRGLLQGLKITDSIQSIVNYKPIVAHINTTKQQLLSLSSKHNVYEIPILGYDGKIAYIQSIFKLIHPHPMENSVVVMAGGLGTRLRPLTNKIPKPMLKIGKKPILQLIVERFLNHGFTNFIFCVNYKSHVIRKHFGDGGQFGASIQYIQEEARLGTAGALGLIKEIGKQPFFVINGDILTDVNFLEMLKHHQEKKSDITIGTRELNYQIPYGVVSINKNNKQITSIEEKPTINFNVSAGIYILEPNILELVPKQEFFDMPSLFHKVLNKKKYNITSFLIEDYWTDIGQHDEYKRANDFFANGLRN